MARQKKPSDSLSESKRQIDALGRQWDRSRDIQNRLSEQLSDPATIDKAARYMVSLLYRSSRRTQDTRQVDAVREVRRDLQDDFTAARGPSTSVPEISAPPVELPHTFIVGSLPISVDEHMTVTQADNCMETQHSVDGSVIQQELTPAVDVRTVPDCIIETASGSSSVCREDSPMVDVEGVVDSGSVVVLEDMTVDSGSPEEDTTFEDCLEEMESDSTDLDSSSPEMGLVQEMLVFSC
jgi:hypothetical protein